MTALKSEESKSKKIMILGLDNAGKTSIVLSLKGENLMERLQPKKGLDPTKEIHRENIEMLGSKFSVWDFGGQESYRKGYLQNLNNQISGASKMIYVIDVQDVKRYDLALKYLAEIINTLGENVNDINLSIFIHKFDPKKDIEKEVISKLVSSIREIIPEKFANEIYKTSIYTIFERSTIEV